MKKLILSIIFGSTLIGSVVAYACTIKDRDRVYDKCLVDKQCGQSASCKLKCINYANKWYYNGCKNK